MSSRPCDGNMATKKELQLHQFAAILVFLEKNHFSSAAKKLKRQLKEDFGSIPKEIDGRWVWRSTPRDSSSSSSTNSSGNDSESSISLTEDSVKVKPKRNINEKGEIKIKKNSKPKEKSKKRADKNEEALPKTSDRYITIDPSKPYKPRITRDQLPKVDESADWLFRPEMNEKWNGSFNIAGSIAKDRKLNTSNGSFTKNLNSLNASISSLNSTGHDSGDSRGLSPKGMTSPTKIKAKGITSTYKPMPTISTTRRTGYVSSASSSDSDTSED